MALTKPAGTWSDADLAVLPDDQTRSEINDGERCVIPSPTSAHAITLAAFIRLLLPIVDRLAARWLTAPLNVFFPGVDLVSRTC